jgi:hypothetical protein
MPKLRSRLDRLPIAEIPPNLAEPVSALVAAGAVLRGVLLAVIEDLIARDPQADLPAVIVEKAEELKLAEIVIGTWREHLGKFERSAADTRTSFSIPLRLSR